MLGVGEDGSQSENNLGSQVGQVGPGLGEAQCFPTAPVLSSPTGGAQGEPGANQREGDKPGHARGQVPSGHSSLVLPMQGLVQALLRDATGQMPSEAHHAEPGIPEVT